AVARALVTPVLTGALETAARRNIQLAPDDRLHAGLRAARVEVHAPEQVAVVGERDRGELELLGLPDELLESGRAIEKAVFRMHVEMDEIGVFHVITRRWTKTRRGTAACRPASTDAALTEMSVCATQSLPLDRTGGLGRD